MVCIAAPRTSVLTLNLQTPRSMLAWINEAGRPEAPCRTRRLCCVVWFVCWFVWLVACLLGVESL